MGELEKREQRQRTISSPVLDSETQIRASVARLLVHYWTENMSASMREVQAADWVEDLRDFPPIVVAEACKRWRRQNPDRRPGPGHIRAFCIEEQRDYGTGMPRLPAPKRMTASMLPESMAEREKMAAEGHDLTERWAREQGYRDFDEYLAKGGSMREAAHALTGLRLTAENAKK